MLRRVSEEISMQGRSWIFPRRAVQPLLATQFPQHLERIFQSEAPYMSVASAPELPPTDRCSGRHLVPSVRVQFRRNHETRDRAATQQLRLNTIKCLRFASETGCQL